MTKQLHFDKEDLEFLYQAFMEDCMTPIAADTYEDMGGHIIHASHLASYFEHWIDSQTIGELRRAIRNWGGAETGKPLDPQD